MRYVRAADIFPADLLKQMQKYAGGETIYIPKEEENRKHWGEDSGGKEETARRNRDIYADYQCGAPICNLAETYFLSEKSIRRIIAEQKREAD